VLDAIVIGAGPAGIATAAMLAARKAQFVLLDRAGVAGGAYARIEPSIVMTSPSRLVGLPGRRFQPAHAYATIAEYHAYLADYAKTLVVQRFDVEAIEITATGFEVVHRRNRGADESSRGAGQSSPDAGAASSDRRIAARTVVIATGMFDFPIVPAIEGPAAVPVIHARDWRDDSFANGQRVLVVGGASSAIEIAESCARRGCIVTVAARKISIGAQKIFGVDPALALFPVLARTRPAKFCDGRFTVPGVDRGFADLRERGAIAVRREPRRIDGHVVELADGARLEVDAIVYATGYRHDTSIVPGVVARTGRGTVDCQRGESVSHRGLYVVGGPCATSAASQYLYGIARDAEAIARRIVPRSA
jgi:putative flavoprotein involved in K+ transport